MVPQQDETIQILALLTEPVLCGFVASLIQVGLDYTLMHKYLCALHHAQILDGRQATALSSMHRLHYVLRSCLHSSIQTINYQLP